MKPNFTKILVLTIFTCTRLLPALAQDTLFMKSGEVLITKVILVRSNEITYKLFNDQEGPLYKVKKSRISIISMNSGTQMNFTPDSRKYSEKKIRSLAQVHELKNAFKWEVLSLFTNDLCLGYEFHTYKNQSAEIKVAYTGIGNGSIDENRDVTGYFLKLGYKFIFPENSISYSIHGHYVKPEICYTEFKVGNRLYQLEYLMLNAGVQAHLFDHMVIELYCGAGVGYTVYEKEQQTRGMSISVPSLSRNYYYSSATLTDPTGFTECFSGGLVLSIHF